MVSTAVFDTLAAVILLAVALLGACTPVLLHEWGKKTGAPAGRSLAYVLGNMLSAGVMVSAGFVHLLGAAVHDLRSDSLFPLPSFLCGLGFIVTLVADYTAETISASTGWNVPTCHAHDRQASPHSLAAVPPADTRTEDLQRVVIDTASSVPGAGRKVQHAPVENGGEGGPRKPQHAFEVENHALQNGNGLRRQHSGSYKGGSPHRRGGRFDPGDPEEDLNADDTEPLMVPGEPPDSAKRHLQRSISSGFTPRSVDTLAATLVHVPEMEQVSFLTAVLMAMALCFHSILEGMAMGAQEGFVDSLHIFIAIAAHKGLAAYALGSSIVDSGATQKRFWAVIATFSLATPVGIGLGRVVASFATSGPAAALSALASGTFLYVAFMEVIPKEMQSHEHGFSKLAMLCLGFGAMSLLAIWA